MKRERDTRREENVGGHKKKRGLGPSQENPSPGSGPSRENPPLGSGPIVISDKVHID